MGMTELSGDAMKRRCFVISPIGSEGSEVREHADAVFDYIITPAMKACEIEPVRSDHLHEPGRISEQMFREIRTDDLSIAVLTGRNPNVFYELALVQAAGRPVIVLLQKGEVLPFDIKDIRCVYYDLKPKALFDRTYSREIIDHVKALEAGGWQPDTPFGSIRQPGAAEPADQIKFFGKAADYGGPSAWRKLLENTEHVFEIMGQSLTLWRDVEGFANLLTKKAEAGCEIRIMMMHQDNPALGGGLNTHDDHDNQDKVDKTQLLSNLDFMFKLLNEVDVKQDNVQLRRMVRGCPHCQITRSDDCAVYVPYFHAERAHFSPLWQCAKGTHLYNLLALEFEALWLNNRNM